MKVLEAIETRRSVKSFDPNHRMSEDEIKQLLSLALLSPSSFNMQNWRFLVITNPEIRSQIKDAAWGQAQVTDASILILVCADLKAWAKEPERYWRNAPQQTQEIIVPMIKRFYENKTELERDEAMRSVGISSQTIMLAAKEMGYDSCPMIGFDPIKVGEIVNLPSSYVIGMMITIGKALEPAKPRAGQIDYSEIVFRDKF
jgi:nitroreductase